MLKYLVTVAAALLAGCTTMRSDIGAIRPKFDPLDMKMLRPGARARVCRTSVFGVPLRSDATSSLADVFNLDGEADVLSDAQVLTESIVTGVYNRTCVELVGDLGREISVVRLPVVGEHEHHH